MEKREDGGELNGEAGSVVGTADGIVTETSKVPFLMLGLDLPPPPLFKDAMEKNIIPQVCLSQAHAQFGGYDLMWMFSFDAYSKTRMRWWAAKISGIDVRTK